MTPFGICTATRFESGGDSGCRGASHSGAVSSSDVGERCGRSVGIGMPPPVSVGSAGGGGVESGAGSGRLRWLGRSLGPAGSGVSTTIASSAVTRRPIGEVGVAATATPDAVVRAPGPARRLDDAARVGRRAVRPQPHQRAGLVAPEIGERRRRWRGERRRRRLRVVDDLARDVDARGLVVDRDRSDRRELDDHRARAADGRGRGVDVERARERGEARRRIEAVPRREREVPAVLGRDQRLQRAVEQGPRDPRGSVISSGAHTRRRMPSPSTSATGHAR